MFWNLNFVAQLIITKCFKLLESEIPCRNLMNHYSRMFDTNGTDPEKNPLANIDILNSLHLLGAQQLP